MKERTLCYTQNIFSSIRLGNPKDIMKAVATLKVNEIQNCDKSKIINSEEKVNEEKLQTLQIV